MTNLNKRFKEAIIESNYCCSVFDYNSYNIEDLQICHILSKSEATKKAIMKAYNCNKTIAEMLMNMPLLNTVVGTRKDNAEYKKTDDIVNINFKLISIVKELFNSYLDKYYLEKLLEIKVFRDVYIILSYAGAFSYYFTFLNDDIKEIQYRFHKELGIYH